MRMARPWTKGSRLGSAGRRLSLADASQALAGSWHLERANQDWACRCILLHGHKGQCDPSNTDLVMAGNCCNSHLLLGPAARSSSSLRESCSATEAWLGLAREPVSDATLSAAIWLAGGLVEAWGVCLGGTAAPGALFGNLRIVLCAADLEAFEPMLKVGGDQDAVQYQRGCFGIVLSIESEMWLEMRCGQAIQVGEKSKFFCNDEHMIWGLELQPLNPADSTPV